MALVSLIDDDRLFFLSVAGTECRQGGRLHSFCDASLRAPNPTMMVVPGGWVGWPLAAGGPWWLVAARAGGRAQRGGGCCSSSVQHRLPVPARGLRRRLGRGPP